MYHKKSPVYPLELFNDLLNVTNINEKSKILEIGTNNSLATLPLFLKGINVTSVELESTYKQSKKKHQINFNNLNCNEINFPKNYFDLVYITKPIYINQEEHVWNKKIELLDFNGKLAIIEVKPSIVSDNLDLNLLEKSILMEFFNYTEEMVKNRILLLPSKHVLADNIKMIYHKVYYKKIIYSTEDFKFYLKSFPEFDLLDIEKQIKILEKINQVVTKICPQGKIIKEYAFLLTILEKNNQTKTQLDT